jgi:cell wall-associated NlpC family hydrolase
MPHNRRSRTLLAYLFAVPVVTAMYAGLAGARLWAAIRPTVATLLGASVVGTIYAGEAWRRAPATPLRVGATLALAVVLVAPAVTHVPVAAAQDKAEALIDAARGYLGAEFRMGAEGQNGKFDCSGLVYRVFADIGELPRISGMRLGATAYKRWFMARGRFSKDMADAERGDLVVWNEGEHIGIYIGDGKAISALRNPWGVTVHGVHKIPIKVTQYLLVNWGRNDGGGDDGGDNGGDNGDNGGDTGSGDTGGDTGTDNNNPPPDDPPADTGSGDTGGDTGSTPGDNTNEGGNNDNNNPPPDDPPATDPPAADPPETGFAKTNNQSGVLPASEATNVPEGSNGMVIATLNLRETADTSSRIVGWVGSGAYVRIIGRAFSPQGYLYFNVETANGSSGWVYSRWVLNTSN